MRPVKVVVTGAGAPGIRGTLYALRHNPDRVAVEVVATDVRSDAVGRYLADRFFTVPPPESEEYLPRLLELCQREDVTIVLPQTTREVEVLSRARQYLWDRGIRVAVSGPRAVALANNKYQLLEVFARLGLPFPAYRLARSEEEVVQYAREIGYPHRPVVVKPPLSNGMRGLRILRENAWDAERFLRDKPDGTEITLEELVGILRKGMRWPELVVTEYLPGPEYTVDAFRGREAFVAVPRLRLAIRSGITFAAQVERRLDLEQYTRVAAEGMGLEYVFGLQFKLDEGGTPKVLECNPRIQGTMVASAFAGHNVIWYAVRELLGQPLTVGEVNRVPLKAAAFYRYWGGLGVLDDRLIDEI